MSAKWDLSAQGVEEIRKVETSLANCVESLKQCSDKLTSTFDSNKDKLGALSDSIEDAISLMNGNNEVCAEAATMLCARLEQFASKIEEFLGSQANSQIDVDDSSTPPPAQKKVMH